MNRPKDSDPRIKPPEVPDETLERTKKSGNVLGGDLTTELCDQKMDADKKREIQRLIGGVQTPESQLTQT